MKTLIYLALVTLAIFCSAGTAMAQCAYPYPAYVDAGGGAYYCVGDGGYMDAGYGLTSAGGCAPGFGGNCGACFTGTLSPYGLCLFPPCAGQDIDNWWVAYELAFWTWCYNSDYCSYSYARSLIGCDPYDWSKLKLPSNPFKSKEPDALDALLHWTHSRG